MYLYLGWFLHHLDLIESYPFQFIQTFERQRPSYKSSYNNPQFTGTPLKVSFQAYKANK